MNVKSNDTAWRGMINCVCIHLHPYPSSGHRVTYDNAEPAIKLLFISDRIHVASCQCACRSTLHKAVSTARSPSPSMSSPFAKSATCSPRRRGLRHPPPTPSDRHRYGCRPDVALRAESRAEAWRAPLRSICSSSLLPHAAKSRAVGTRSMTSRARLSSRPLLLFGVASLRSMGAALRV